jgi:hypothetical protein
VNEQDNQYNFNQQDYEMTVRIYNGYNDVYLTNESWEDLVIEEDIFDWKIKGSLVIKTPYESFERDSVTSLNEKKNDIYKFRNDGRDTIFISIKPKTSSVPGLVDDILFEDSKWLIEFEGVIYDTEDLSGAGIYNKMKKVFFWEKVYQLMIERDSDFSTANSGRNKGNANTTQSDNLNRSLPTGTSVGELLKSIPEFQKYTKNIPSETEWDSGSDENLIYYSSPAHAKFIDDLEYLLNYTTSSKEYDYQPCIFKFERASTKMTPKQFSLKPIKKYFEQAGKEVAKNFQIEHFFLEESSENEKAPYIKKTPINDDPIQEIKAEKYNTIGNYQAIDFSGLTYSQKLANYRIVSYNSSNGQFNEEAAWHSATEYNKFYKQNIANNVLTNNKEDRLKQNPYIKDGLNTRTLYSMRSDDIGRLAEGRNKILKYYLFSNLGIAFTALGLTVRQPGRFFGLSKLTGNTREYDSKLEGQYFVTNIIHHFSNKDKAYQTQLTGVKVHTYFEETTFEPDNVDIIKGSSVEFPPLPPFESTNTI